MSGLMWRRLLLAGLLAAFLVEVSVPAALATSQGAALDTGRITVQTKLVAGHLYRLARFSVRNPGSARTQYDLIVTPLSTATRDPDPTWFSFSPKQVTLQPGKSQVVTLSLRLPKGAAAGDYETLVGARVAQSDSGTSLAAAAAAFLSFSVASSQKATVLVWWPVPAVAVGALGLFLLRKRFRLRLERR